jgi:cell wall-associated NlpC family hydrolase
MVIAAFSVIKKTEPDILDDFNNQYKTPEDKHYTENFKEHDKAWWDKIRINMALDALSTLEFKAENRAITIANTHARALPDATPDFFHASLPGQGFPFDNLQESALWTGTPLYVVTVSKDKAWSLVLTPDGYFAWVSSHDIAYASPAFIRQWQKAARKKLVAITQTEVSIVDTVQQFQFTGYIGAVFPMVQQHEQQTSILIPVKRQNHQAGIKVGMIDSNAASVMPLAASRKNLVNVINQLKNRPYGWGGAFFFNDCSQEIKSIFTPFGIWLPRNSAQQAQSNATLDLSKYSMDERMALLKEKGHPLMTIIYIGGHVMLYVGTTDNQQIMTYQNIWGMAPAQRDARFVIGQSLFFPLLQSYPEKPELSSLASKSYFKLVFLDELNTTEDSPSKFTNRFLEPHRMQ